MAQTVMVNQTVGKLRGICTSCVTKPTSKIVGGMEFESKHLNRQETIGARYATLALSQIISNRLAVVLPNSLDGVELVHEEFVPGVPQSAGTGGLSKYICGRDPQEYRKKMMRKRQWTERMYIHQDICNLNFIGSRLQQGGDSSPMAFIQNNATLQNVAQARELSTTMMVENFRAFADHTDGSMILGNHKGGTYGHFDGILKQTAYQEYYTHYNAGTVPLPDVAGGAYILTYNGNPIGVYTSESDLVTGINEYRTDKTGEALWAASGDGAGTITITATDPEQLVYGHPYGMRIFYAADGIYDDCAEPLKFTILENAMSYAESPLIFDYSVINEANIYEVLKEAVKGFRKKLIGMFEGPIAESLLNNLYIAMDPFLMLEKQFGFYQETVKADRALERMNMLNNMFPPMYGINALKGTGLWYMTIPENIIFLTNLQTNGNGQSLNNTEMWYDPDCKLVKFDHEAIGNVLVGDYSLISSNFRGSHFESSLTDPYKPENLPHYAAEPRKDAIYVENNQFFAAGQIEAIQNQDTSWTLSLTDHSRGNITAWAWQLFDDAQTEVGALSTQNGTVNLTDIQYQSLVYGVLTVSDGTNTDQDFLPKKDWN